MILDNNTIAILTKVNELAARHGIKAYEFTAQVQHNAETHQTDLDYVAADPHIEKKLDAMLDSIASRGQVWDGAMHGTDKQIIDALDQAIAKAPRPRGK